MVKRIYKNKIITGFAIFMMIFTLVLDKSQMVARAASGTVYTCSIVPCYSHPVTGQIEDSGGEASYATGQGMVESALYTTGILEVADDGTYYLTVRFSLGDFTSGHSFLVQNVGDSSWYEPATGTTGQGSDSNGATFDACIQVPSENCIVRGSMYVEPMGREVIFYLYPTDYVEGNSTDMNATIVTSSSNYAEGASETSSGNISKPAESVGAASLPEKKSENGNAKTEDKPIESTLSKDSGATPMKVSTETLDNSKGLSLSTEEETDTVENKADNSIQIIVVTTISVVIGGLILIGVVALLIYYFRRNWKRLGGGEDDDE